MLVSFDFSLIKHPRTLAKIWIKQLFQWLPDEQYLRLLFRLNMGKRLNLNKPQTFSEKLQWLKLHDHNPEYTKLVDKVAVKEYVAKVIGDEYVIPTYGVWEKAEDIDWDALPNKFVLKCNHDSGGLIICKDKARLDKEAAIKKINKSLQTDFYKVGREWPYKNVPRRIIAEMYIESCPATNDLPDYKWFCFGGEPKYCQVIQNRTTNETIDFFDDNWNHQEFTGLNPVSGPVFRQASVIPACPANLKTQIRIAKELSKQYPFSRIDLYEANNKTYFGEITFYPMSGLGVFSPDQYNDHLGKMITLPNKSGE